MIILKRRKEDISKLVRLIERGYEVISDLDGTNFGVALNGTRFYKMSDKLVTWLKETDSIERK